MNTEALKAKFEANKKALIAKKNKLAEQRKNEEGENLKGVEPLVTCRVLFISALDKIYNAILLLMLIAVTYINFKGNFGSLEYGFFARVGKEIISLAILFVVYLFFNWLYRCQSKTMLCLTKNEVYKEKYIPFKRGEVSIPLNKITGVSTLNVFWIFRSVTIHQYGKLPMIFFTWNNKEFKDKLTELITTEKDKIKNAYENKKLLSFKGKFFKAVMALLCVVILVLSIIRFFGYMGNTERKIAGKYTYGDKKIVLKKDASCDVTSLTDKNVESCTWAYDEDMKAVNVRYEYTYNGYFGETPTFDYINMKYDKDKKTLDYSGKKYKK